jgi:ABC-type Fe3+/spermidine/putrescine transport system ATPase subunit
MNLGNLIQLDTAHEIYTKPKTKFVADFVGKINFLPGTMVVDEGDWGMVDVANTSIRVPKSASAKMSGEVTVALRPEHLMIGAAGSTDANGHNVVQGKIIDRIFAGNLMHVSVEVDGNELMVEAKPADDIPGDGASVGLHWAPDHVVLLTE